MQTEYEIKVLDVDINVLKKRLKQLSAAYVGQHDFRRYIFPLADPQQWVRLRTDGQKTTLTYKHAIKDSIDGVQELEIEVSNFDNTKQLLELTGLQATNYQENGREEYECEGVMVTIDSWPGIPDYVEIEGPDQASVESLLERLELQSYPKTSKTVADVYKHYGATMPG